MFRYILNPKKINGFIKMQNLMLAHSKTCPSAKIVRCPSSSKKESKKSESRSKRGSGSGSGSGYVSGELPKRALTSGPCRFGFIPEEWFTIFYPITGVSGPYIFAFVLGNYLISKEIYIMEHEYYSGLSIALVCYLLVKKFGKAVGSALDFEVDSIVAEYQKTRDDEMALYNNAISSAKQSQQMAKGHELLMAAKKENIKMQLEAVYRERTMHVYTAVKGRMEYHVRKHRAENRIHQKWMIQWILQKVMESITPDFEKQALDSAIRDLAAAAGSSA